MIDYIILKTLHFKIKFAIENIKKAFIKLHETPVGEPGAGLEILGSRLEPTRRNKAILEKMITDSKNKNLNWSKSEKRLVETSLEYANISIEFFEALEKTHKADLETVNKLKSNPGKLYSYNEVFE